MCDGERNYHCICSKITVKSAPFLCTNGFHFALALFAATKETAYVYALSLAAIAHSVAKVCALGDATSCSCEEENLDLPESGGSTEYEMGCSDNVEFGITFATRFLQLRHSGSGLIQDIKAHNMRTGAKVSTGIPSSVFACVFTHHSSLPWRYVALGACFPIGQAFTEAPIAKLQECLICTIRNSEIAQGRAFLCDVCVQQTCR